ncbi:hypothetical protein [Mycobacterium sp. 4D054]|uniref:hypothetical protein n=1 Tax=Mycobacterium sp. 4D054 TaxID=3457440 RepID=UPI003FD5D512
MLRGVDRHLTVGEALLTGGNLTLRVRENVASSSNLDEGLVDALLLDLDIGTDIGYPLIRLGDSRNQGRNVLAVAVRCAVMFGSRDT